MVGKTISHYKVLEKLGQGGMGEVYLAEDSRLDRKVALKILPQHLSDRAELRERFEREARAVSSLNHPPICTLYDIGEQDGIHYLVMEHLVGETLEARLAKGPLALEQTLEYAIQIADALEAAHKQNIVHRDLKPSNIMLTPGGHVKVMDFGLAKRVTPVEGKEEEVTTKLTKDNSFLGTVPYMSPEQLRGQEVDSRSDIFSFGVVLYEMLAGVHPFKKGGQIETANAILSETAAPLSRYTNDISGLLQHAVKKMLAKKPDRRYQLIHEVRTDLTGVISEVQEPLAEPMMVSPIEAVSAAQPAPWKRAIPWTITALTILIAGLIVWNLGPSVPTTSPSITPQPTVRLVVALPDNKTIALLPSPLALSPDGSRLAYVATYGGTAQLYLRPMDEPEAKPISGTEDAKSPFFSSDGQSLGFFAEGKLKKVSVRGGTPVIVSEVSSPNATASWGTDGTIVLTPHHTGSVIFQVPATGGAPQALTTLDSKNRESAHLSPQLLPDGKTLLFTVDSADNPQVVVQSLDTGERRVVLQGARHARFIPIGHLVYVQEGTLMAVAFDLEQLKATGAPIPVLEGVMQPSHYVPAYIAFSDSGTLAYVPADTSPQDERTLVWVDRKGSRFMTSAATRWCRSPSNRATLPSGHPMENGSPSNRLGLDPEICSGNPRMALELRSDFWKANFPIPLTLGRPMEKCWPLQRFTRPSIRTSGRFRLRASVNPSFSSRRPLAKPRRCSRPTVIG
jgi:serine/threonine-protein kinase